MLSLDTYKELFVQPDFLAESVLEEVAIKAKREGRAVEELIVSEGLLPTRECVKVMASHFDLPAFDQEKDAADPAFIRHANYEFLDRYSMAPLRIRSKKLVVAVSDPTLVVELQMLSQWLQAPLTLVYALPQQVRRMVHGISQEPLDAIRALASRATVGTDEDQAGNSVIDGVAVQIVDRVIEAALYRGSSDVHLEPHEQDMLVRFRVDGILQDVVQLPKHVQSLIVSRIKILSRLRSDDHSNAQDGKFRYQRHGVEVDIRVSVVPITGGEKIVMRLLAADSQFLDLEALGLDEDTLAQIRRIASHTTGMILSTGPTGSGKTSTMYAIIQHVNSREINISTIEDPVEYSVAGVNQIQVNRSSNLDFASGLRALVRQDPDVILVGEIRDDETADVAVNAALAGHLVLSTMHTNSAATTIPRLVDMGTNVFVTATSVRAIVGQRLLRRLCTRCKKSESVTAASLKDQFPQHVIKSIFGRKKSIRVHVPVGCEACGKTGYRGRTGVFEVLEFTDRVRQLVMDSAPAHVIEAAAKKDGMKTMLERSIQKVLSGETTLSEVQRTID